MSEAVYWIGTEDQEHAELLKACEARCKQWGDENCPRPDIFCAECEHDQAVAMRVSKKRFDLAVANGEIDAADTHFR